MKVALLTAKSLSLWQQGGANVAYPKRWAIDPGQRLNLSRVELDAEYRGA